MAIAFLIRHFYSSAIGTARTGLKLSWKKLKKKLNIAGIGSIIQKNICNARYIKPLS
jgi:hypothetical protein